MKYLPTTLTTIMAFGMLAVSIPVMAQNACEDQVGSAFGLCNAYCEAMDCDSDDPQASDKACVRVLDNFLKVTGSEIPPCSSGPPQAGESCESGDADILFEQGDGGSYGCADWAQFLQCGPGGTWICRSTG